MIDVLNISIPFFALIFLGFVARALGFLNQGGASAMSKFAFFIALPPFLFLKVAASDPASIFNWGFVWRYEICTIFLFLVAALISRKIFGFKRLESGIFGLNAAYPNYGYIGIPLVILAFGDQAALPIGLILVADTITLLTLTAFFVAGNELGPTAISMKMLQTVATNPLVLAVIAGITFSSTELLMPKLPDVFLNMLAGAATPVALFALGATLFGQPVKNAIKELSTLTVLKLVIHPLMISIFFIGIPGQNPLWIKVAIISSCLPIAANVFMLANHYNAYAGRSASAIFLTTIMASVSVPLFLYWLFSWDFMNF